jgi:pre-mRNA cleavage complex 2 protein Pcf11
LIDRLARLTGPVSSLYYSTKQRLDSYHPPLYPRTMAYQYRPPYPPPPPAIGQGHGYQHPHPTPPGDPFRAYYADRLRQLTFNSRPLIQELSVMAMQQRDGHSREGMRAVVESIESAVLQVCGLLSCLFSAIGLPRLDLLVKRKLRTDL